MDAEAVRSEWSEWLEAHDLETSVDPETAVSEDYTPVEPRL